MFNVKHMFKVNQIMFTSIMICLVLKIFFSFDLKKYFKVSNTAQFIPLNSSTDSMSHFQLQGCFLASEFYVLILNLKNTNAF